jgi:LysM repeat protein
LPSSHTLVYDASGMRLHASWWTGGLRRILPALALTAALALAACGGSGGTLDPSKVPTATLPAELPEPTIIASTPIPSQGGRTYTIQAGDSPASIAEQFGVSVEALMEANDIVDPTALQVGQVLTIPGDVPIGPFPTPVSGQPTPSPSTGRATPAGGESSYAVQSGDNASDIADRFGITIEELAAANNVTVAELRELEVGQVLIIPVGSPPATPSAPETATPTPP